MRTNTSLFLGSLALLAACSPSEEVTHEAPVLQRDDGAVRVMSMQQDERLAPVVETEQVIAAEEKNAGIPETAFVADIPYLAEVASIAHTLQVYHDLHAILTLGEATDAVLSDAEKASDAILSFLKEDILSFQESGMTTQKYPLVKELGQQMTNEALIWIDAKHDPVLVEENYQTLFHAFDETRASLQSERDAIVMTELEKVAFNTAFDSRIAVTDAFVRVNYPQLYHIIR